MERINRPPQEANSVLSATLVVKGFNKGINVFKLEDFVVKR